MPPFRYEEDYKMPRTTKAEKDMENVMEAEISEKEAEDIIQEDMENNEEDYLRGLLDAAEDAEEETVKLDIVRSGKHYFSFEVHPLSDAEVYAIRKKYTKYAKNRARGVKVAEELDMAKYRSSLIYNATVAADQKKLWNNKSVQEGLRRKGKHIINALDVIDAVLLPGEKENVIDVINDISGYGSEEAMVDEAKN